MDFGTKFKQLRIEKKLTQLQMANILDISKSNISKYEAGSVEPNLDTLIKLADFFDVTVDYLLGRTDEAKINHPSKNDEELKFLSAFHNLNQDNKDIILGDMKRYIKEQKQESASKE